jgi:hypothetical protein
MKFDNHRPSFDHRSQPDKDKLWSFEDIISELAPSNY